MSFLQDFIEDTAKMIRSVAEDNRLFGKVMADAQARSEVQFRIDLLSDLKNAKIVNVDTRQAFMFWDLPNLNQDLLKLRSPYSCIYVSFTGGNQFIIPDYDDHLLQIVRKNVRAYGALILETSQDNRRLFTEPVSRVFQTLFFCPVDIAKENVYVMTFGILPDGTLTTRPNSDLIMKFAQSDNELRRREMHSRAKTESLTSKQIIAWTIHMLNYLTSPSVVLERKEHSPELQKSREKKGKPLLPGWYEITYRKKNYRSVVPSSGVPGTHHSFRYDVRGHFMSFTKGRLAGRVIWCPDHQRGLANDLYRPKSYRVQPERTEPSLLS